MSPVEDQIAKKTRLKLREEYRTNRLEENEIFVVK